MQRNRSRRRIKGGGRLNRIPVGPGSRSEDGTPAAGYSNPTEIATRRAEAVERIGQIADMKNEEKESLAMNLPVFLRQSAIVKTQSDEANKALGRTESQSFNEAVEQVTSDFIANWEFMYICGHGKIVAPALRPITVPERTYIRFQGQSACAATINGAIPSYLVNDDSNDYKEKMAVKFLRNKNPFQSFTTAEERDVVFTDPYAPNYCKSKVHEPNVEIPSSCLGAYQQTKTIYGPGENIINIKLKFANSNYVVVLGVYNAPVPEDFVDNVIHYNEDKKNINKLTDIALFGKAPNLKPEYIGHEVSLETVLQELPPVPEGKVRFLHIVACRNIEDAVYDPPALAFDAENINKIKLDLSTGIGDLTERLNAYKRVASSSASRQQIAFGLRRASLKPNVVRYDRIHELIHLLRKPASELTDEQKEIVKKSILNNEDEYKAALSTVTLYPLSNAAIHDPLEAKKLKLILEIRSILGELNNNSNTFLDKLISPGLAIEELPNAGLILNRLIRIPKYFYKCIQILKTVFPEDAVDKLVYETKVQFDNTLFATIKSDIYDSVPPNSKALLDLLTTKLEGRLVNEIVGPFTLDDTIHIAPVFRYVKNNEVYKQFITRIYDKMKKILHSAPAVGGAGGGGGVRKTRRHRRL